MQNTPIVAGLVLVCGVLLGITVIKARVISVLVAVVVGASSLLVCQHYHILFQEWFIYVEVPSLLVALGVFLVAQTTPGGDDRRMFKVTLVADNKRKRFIKDINRGVGIFAASGGGKSESVVYQIAQHLAKYEFAGVVNDYKDFELTEILYPLYRDLAIPFNVFAIHDVNRSVRINPIDPKYIQTEQDVNGIVKVLMLNLSGEVSDDTAVFFRGGAESLMAGVIWRLKESYPQYCTLPHVISILLNYDNLHEKGRPFGKLVRFLEADLRARMLASTFLTGLGSEKQTASLFATLAEGLRSLISAEIFFLLSGNDIDLAVNADGSRQVLSCVNNPGPKEPIISALNATVMATCFARMAERGRKPSFVLMDEGVTLKIMGLGRRIATLRSYGVSFIYCIQDKIQGVAQWGGKDFYIKEILTNLSTQFFGKVNDPDTANYYEKFFEIIKKEQRSYSKADGWFGRGDNRVTTSKKDEAKVRGYEFFKMRQGEFVMFNEGVDDKFRFYYQIPEKAMPPVLRMITPSELMKNYLQILNEAAALFVTNQK